MTKRIRIGFATADWAINAEHGVDGKPTMGGSGHYRMGMPARFLATQPDFEVAIGTLLSDRSGSGRFGVRTWDEGPARDQWDLDIIVLQRWMFESVALETQIARARGQVVVNDIDDWFDGLKPSNQAYWSTHPKYNKRENRDNYRLVLLASSAITCSTPFLAKQYAAHDNVTVLENCLEVDRWPMRDTWRPEPTVGWVGAVPWRSGDLEVLRGVVDPLLRKHALTFHHSGAIDGASTVAQLAQMDPTRVETSPMVTIEDYPEQFAPIDIGLVPLSGVAFNQAKSWIKGLEYAASGIPFVASASPEYRRLHEQYGLGEIAYRRRDWYPLMKRFLDPEDRQAYAAQARAVIEADFSMARRGHQWADFYRGLLA